MLRALGPFPHGPEYRLAAECLDRPADEVPALVAALALGQLGQAVSRLVIGDAGGVTVAPAECERDTAQAAEAVAGRALFAQVLRVEFGDQLIECQRAFFNARCSTLAACGSSPLANAARALACRSKASARLISPYRPNVRKRVF